MTWYKPWTWFSSNDSPTEDSTYEERVKERCDHEWDDSIVAEDLLELGQAYLEDGFLVIPTYEKVERYCENCGEPYYDAKRYTAHGRQHTFRRGTGAVAVPIAFALGPNTKVSDALYEPVRDEADYAVDRDGEVEAIEGEDGGRVIVNESEQQALDEPVAAGGPTDD